MMKECLMIDWKNVKILGWSTPITRVRLGEPVGLEIERETPSFIWVTFRGRLCKLRKSDFVSRQGTMQNVYLSRPTMEFKVEVKC